MERATGFEPATIGLGSRLDVVSLVCRHSPQDAVVRPLSSGCNGGGPASHTVAGAGLRLAIFLDLVHSGAHIFCLQIGHAPN